MLNILFQRDNDQQTVAGMMSMWKTEKVVLKGIWDGRGMMKRLAVIQTQRGEEGPEEDKGKMGEGDDMTND